MPSITESLKSDLSKYVSVKPSPASVINIEDKHRTVNNLRCPLPPFNFSPDVVRHFDAGGQVPQVRIIPVPFSANSGNTTINNTQVTTAAAAATSTTASLKSVTQTLSTSILNPGDVFTGTVSLAKSFQLLQIGTTDACNVRLYGSFFAQLQDAARLPDAPVPAETVGIITDVITDTSPFQVALQNRIGANGESPQTILIYVTVINTTAATTEAFTISFQYIPLES